MHLIIDNQHCLAKWVTDFVSLPLHNTPLPQVTLFTKKMEVETLVNVSPGTWIASRPLGFEPRSMDFKACLWLHPVHQVLSSFSEDIDLFEMNSTEIDGHEPLAVRMPPTALCYDSPCVQPHEKVNS